MHRWIIEAPYVLRLCDTLVKGGKTLIKWVSVTVLLQGISRFVEEEKLM